MNQKGVERPLRARFAVLALVVHGLFSTEFIDYFKTDHSHMIG